MSHADFVHLRVHTAFSLSEGAIKIDELVALCCREAMPAVAITDTGNLFGVLEFSQACKGRGVQPIVGCQIAVAETVGAPRSPRQSFDSLVLLCQDETGYGNLVGLVSRSFLGIGPGDPPHVSHADLADHAAGLIALTGGPSGPINRPLVQGQGDAADACLRRLAEIFPGRLYVELQRHGTEDEAAAEAGLLDLADRHGLPLVATNEVFFADPTMYQAHDALICIAEGSYVSQSDRRRLTPEHGFRSAGEMRALFADVPEAVDNTLVIAARCAFMVEGRAPILPPYDPTGKADEAEALRRLARMGLQQRLAAAAIGEDAAAPYHERLAFELDVIISMRYAGYFLIVADFVQWAKGQGIPVGPGRGSGAGSVVAWVLLITDLDPIRHGLLFERFLNPERISMPDFDIDFCQDRRDEVIGYVQRRYGADRVAQIITFGKLNARAALRDVGRVLEMPYGQVDRLCKLVPNNPANPVSLEEAIAGEPQLQKARTDDEAVATLLDIALRLEGLYRHASTHAAGVVIGDRPLQELVPLYRDPRSAMPVTQFSMKDVEKAGLVKFDFLGLKTLTMLRRCEGLLAARDVRLDLLHLPLDDRPTYEMLSRGDTVGVFQMESTGMRDALRRLRPDRFDDIVAMVALYRPGPMDNIPRYINAKHGVEPPDYLHEKLVGLLRETFGVIIYQEQVMQIAQVLAGYTLGAADILRRAMGKKIKSEMDAQREVFVSGAVAAGVGRPKAIEIFNLVDKFAGYGFNKSHAAAYALIAFQTAYLKANFPVEFLAASMSLDQHNTDKLSVFRIELQRLGIRLMPPDINRSGVDFAVEQVPGGTLAIRYALAAVRNVGAQAMAAVVAERATAGPFRSVADLIRRTAKGALNRRQLENLAQAGAFDDLHGNRRQVVEAVDALVRLGQGPPADSSQASLFGDAPSAASDPPLPAIADWSPMERLSRERDALGFYLSAHPLDAYGDLSRFGVTPAADVISGAHRMGGEAVVLAGTVLGRRERNSARGRFAFIELSDPTGTFEVVAFSEVFSVARDLLESGRPLRITASVRQDGDSVKLMAQAIEALDDALPRGPSMLTIYLDDPRAVGSLRARFADVGRGKGRVRLILPIEQGQEVEITLPSGYAITPPIQAAIKAISGVLDVREGAG
ncbi:MAG: DNA polymerase III subunit alpha [Alphaproteobacteria bacterium]|nr:DNA polymerase III subunit alpha [Alphaproteobacteria bacterium]